MYLGGQAIAVKNERGYAMAALLVTMTVTAILMLALLPVWKQQAQREKEAELAFRGEQYARAIYLFRTKNGNQPPPNVDVLVQGKYLRKKYKDPITGDEFQPIFGGQQPNQPGRGGTPPGRGGSPQGRGVGGPTPTSVGSGLSGGGIMTVRSKSKQASIRIYNGGAHYNEWNFIYRGRGRGGDGNPMGNPGQGSPLPGGGRGPGGTGRPGDGRGGPGGFGGPGIGPGGPGRGVGPGRGTLPAPGGPGRGGGRGQF